MGEFPLLARLQERFRTQGFTILGISIDDDCAKAVDVARGQGVTWPVVCEGKGLDGNIARLYSVDGTPTYFLIGRDGRIAAKRFAGENLEAILGRALAAEPAPPPKPGR